MKKSFLLSLLVLFLVGACMVGLWIFHNGDIRHPGFWGKGAAMALGLVVLIIIIDKMLKGLNTVTDIIRKFT
ncbi:MAG TPA: hypothetical protein VHZ04_02450 [Candidatus Paceibacterota bacterium]|nr:hypothetical protein [Candidatus Paceibacterota bacterium]